MCQQAARITDPCVHGGMVAMGSTDTLIGYLPAARKGDAHVCPIHPPGKIVKASATVIINGVGAARKLDMIACASPPTPAGGVGVVYDVKDENAQLKLVYAEGSVTKDANGNITAAQGGFGLMSTTLGGQTDAGDFTLGGALKSDVAYAKGSYQGDYMGGQANAKAAVVTDSASGYIAPKGDKYNPYAAGSVTGEALEADASSNALAGYDGKRVGVVADAGASANLVQGSASGRVGIPLGWMGFPNSSIDINVTGTASIGVGAQAGGGGYYDKDEGRVHVIADFAVKLLGGLGINLDISIGKKFQAPPPPPAPAPDAIRMGIGTVFFGG